MSPAAFALLVSAALFLVVLALVMLGWLAYQSRKESRIQARLQMTAAESVGEFGNYAGHPLLAKMARRGRVLERWLDPESESARLLLQAGWRSLAARATWYAFQAVLPVVAAVAILLVWVFAGEKTKGMLIVLYGVMVVILSLLIPRFVLRRVAANRRDRIKNEVPLFIHLLVLLFEAGLSTRQAIASLVREGHGVLPELGGEFELVLRQLEAGGDTAEVLQNLGNSLDVADLTSVLGVLRQVDRYGGEIREPLLDALSVLEERRSLDLREEVNRMSGRMTVVMVLFFFPALLIFVAGPAFFSIIHALKEATAR